MFLKLKQLFAGFSVMLGITALLFSPVMLGVSGYATNNGGLTPTRDVICTGASCPVTGGREFTGATRNSVVTIIIDIARFITFVAVGLAILFMVWGGIRYITGGDEGATSGKKLLINATIGLIIAIVAYTIVNIIAGLVTGNLLEQVSTP